MDRSVDRPDAVGAGVSPWWDTGASPRLLSPACVPQTGRRSKARSQTVSCACNPLDPPPKLKAVGGGNPFGVFRAIQQTKQRQGIHFHI